jgi:hypothetical protein
MYYAKVIKHDMESQSWICETKKWLQLIIKDSEQFIQEFVSGSNVFLVTDKKGVQSVMGIKSVKHFSQTAAIREWFTSRLEAPQNGQVTVEVTQKLIQNLLLSCNYVLSDPRLAEELIPLHTNDFDFDQGYNNDYFSLIKMIKEQLDPLYKTWDWSKPLYYYWFS